MNAPTLYFYDLETTGFNPREDRIMQFAGQRVDMDLKTIGEPHNILVKITDEILPSPDAILVTGITPQQTKADGITEAEFLKIFEKEIAQPGTIFVGFNSIRFDDEFMRFLLYRNFYDPYEWQWKEDRSRWDLLDVVRMTRALRPEGIKWPVDSEGKPANRLTLLTSINGLDHANAHDALSDVEATIDLARLLKTKQPKLFGYLLEMRDKKKIAELVNKNEPFIYSSGKYESEFEKTTAAIKLVDHPKKQGVLVYDLRKDPSNFLNMTPVELAEAWKYKKNSTEPRLPVKTLQFNRCPAVAPLGVLDDGAQKRLNLGVDKIKSNLAKLKGNKQFVNNLLEAVKLLDKQQQATLLQNEQDVDSQLYDGFFDDTDRTKLRIVRAAAPDELSSLNPDFKDPRLQALLPLYIARNFPSVLDDTARQRWDSYRERRLAARISAYFSRIDELRNQKLNKQQEYLLEELRLYGESLIPGDY
jgi:exodeoxyribonuclease I